MKPSPKQNSWRVWRQPEDIDCVVSRLHAECSLAKISPRAAGFNQLEFVSLDGLGLKKKKKKLI